VNKRLPIFVLLLLPLVSGAQDSGAHIEHGMVEHGMTVDMNGAVMNENRTALPRDCSAVSRDYQITVRAGQSHAGGIPGAVFGMDEKEIRVEPCSRIELTFINDDEVRHQWMVHGLPRYLYPAGMFHIEVEGGQSRTGTLIVPGEDRTYLIHCDLPQHMEMGMRGQLIVGRGSGDLWDVAGVSDKLRRDSYWSADLLWVTGLIAFGAGIGIAIRGRL
jgi:plastocyanin